MCYFANFLARSQKSAHRRSLFPHSRSLLTLFWSAQAVATTSLLASAIARNDMLAARRHVACGFSISIGMHVSSSSYDMHARGLRLFNLNGHRPTHVRPPHMTCMYPPPHMTCMYPPPHRHRPVHVRPPLGLRRTTSEPLCGHQRSC
jgi:hypothetical protein